MTPFKQGIHGEMGGMMIASQPQMKEYPTCRPVTVAQWFCRNCGDVKRSVPSSTRRHHSFHKSPHTTAVSAIIPSAADNFVAACASDCDPDNSAGVESIVANFVSSS